MFIIFCFDVISIFKDSKVNLLFHEKRAVFIMNSSSIMFFLLNFHEKDFKI